MNMSNCINKMYCGMLFYEVSETLSVFRLEFSVYTKICLLPGNIFPNINGCCLALIPEFFCERLGIG